MHESKKPQQLAIDYINSDSEYYEDERQYVISTINTTQTETKEKISGFSSNSETYM